MVRGRLPGLTPSTLRGSAAVSEVSLPRVHLHSRWRQIRADRRAELAALIFDPRPNGPATRCFTAAVWKPGLPPHCPDMSPSFINTVCESPGFGFFFFLYFESLKGNLLVFVSSGFQRHIRQRACVVVHEI